MPDLRTGPDGPLIVGTAVGDVLVWNGVEWVPGPLAAAIVPLSRELFVDAGTTVPAAAQDGSIAAPFGPDGGLGAIGRALAAAVLLPPGPVVLEITAGDYAENVVLPPRDGLTLQGSGITASRIIGQPGAAALGWAPSALEGATIASFRCRDLAILGAAGQRAVEFVSSTVAPDTLLADGAGFERVEAVAGAGAECALFSRVGIVALTDSSFIDDLTNVATCSVFATFNSVEIDQLDLTWDQGFVGGVPGLGRGSFILGGETRVLNGITARAQTSLEVQEGCRVAAGTAVNALVGVGLSTAAGAIAPRFMLNGQHTGPTVLPYPDLVGGGELCDLDRGEFQGAVTLSVVAGATRLAARGFDALFEAAISAGDLVDFDIDGSSFLQASLAVAGSGTISRSLETMSLLAIPPGPSSTFFPFSVPFSAVGPALVPVMSTFGPVANLAFISTISALGLTIDNPVAAPGTTANALVAR